MPLTTSLPSPSIEWVDKYMGPPGYQNPSSKHGTAATVSAHNQQVNIGGQNKATTERSTSGAALNRWTDYLGRGTAGTSTWDGTMGRGTVLVRRAGNNSIDGSGIVPTGWYPQLTQATGQAAGSFQNPESLVCVVDWHVFWDIAGASPMNNDQAGVWFIPVGDGALGVTCAAVPAGAGGNIGVSGFGCFLNNVAGVAAYEYVSWRGDGTVGARTILERVSVPVATVPSVQLWNTIRFILTSATNTEAATVQMIVNGDTIIPGRQFGTALLDDAAGSSASNPFGYAIGFNTAGVNNVFRQLAVKLGRYTPGGTALEPA